MKSFQEISLFILRISLGWVMFYAGITKVLDPAWSAEGYLKGAKTFSGFYAALTESNILPLVNFLNEWGLTLIGISLIFGVFVRLSSIAGAILMLMYYFPVLEFPYIPGAHAFIIDDHIIYALVFIVLATFRAGRVLGLETWCSGLPICSRYPVLRKWLG